MSDNKELKYRKMKTIISKQCVNNGQGTITGLKVKDANGCEIFVSLPPVIPQG